MILFTFLGHQWKSFWRSRGTGKSLAVQIFMGFITVYLLAVAIGVGFYLKELIPKTFPGQDPVKVFCGWILYYFFSDIIFRFMWQDLPTLAIQPYLVQNIRRRQLIQFLNIRSLFTFINLLPVFLFVPFTVGVIGQEYGPGAAAGFLVSIFFLTGFNHFMILYIKRKTILSLWWMIGFCAAVSICGLCDYFGFFSLRAMSSAMFTRLLFSPWLCLIPVAMAAAAFVNNYKFLYKNLYLEDIERKARKREGSEYAFLNRFGDIGELIALELKLMLRNKRPRSVLMLSGVFLFYGFIFYKPQYIANGSWGALLFGGVFVTGLFISNYGQFLFAWQSSHFDGLMASHLSVRTYIKSKFVLFTAVCTILLLLSSFYGLLSTKILLIQLVAYFYDIGVNTVVVIYIATRNYKAIDIGKKAAFNYQGTGSAQWIYTLLIFLIPIAIYLPVKFMAGSWAAVVTLGVAGLISFFLQDWWIDVLTREFFKRKYSILEGFRQK